MFRDDLELDTTASIAEMYAIFRVVAGLDGTRDCATVLSDSQGSINAIFNLRNRCYIPSYLRSILARNEGRITLGWIPGHMGIEGNERADALARSPGDVGTKVVPPSEVYCRAAALRGELTARWNAWLSKDFFLKRHWRRLDHPSPNPTLTKLQVKILTRLRLGHTRLTHGHWFDGSDPPQCITCGGQLTVIHILKHCRKTWAFFRGEPPPLGDLLDPQQGSDSPLFNLISELGLSNSF